MAHLVKHVYTYEIRKEHADVVAENIKLLGAKNVTLKDKDVREGIAETPDLVVLDLPAPWEAIDAAYKSLKVGGFLVSYSPMITQAIDMVNGLIEHEGFIVMKTVTLKEEKWEISGRKARPKSRSNIHSGFLTFARKIR